MFDLPLHVPVCRLETGGDPGKRLMLARLIDELAVHELAAASIDVSGLEHGAEEASSTFVRTAAARADLVLVDGPYAGSTAFLQLGASSVADPGPVPTFVCADLDGIKACCTALVAWLHKCLAQTPVGGCVLIGGRSSRMGRPKHLLRRDDGRTWLEGTVDQLRPFVSRCVLAGDGDLPASCTDFERVSDLSGVIGPLAGIGAVLQHHPWTSWLVVACDMPDIDADAIDWLLSRRRPGFVAVIPVNAERGGNEPLFAWYDFRSLSLIQQLLRQGSLRPREMAAYKKVLQPPIPASLVHCWRNVNRPEEL